MEGNTIKALVAVTPEGENIVMEAPSEFATLAGYKQEDGGNMLLTIRVPAVSVKVRVIKK
jgi:hypothetical protein